MGKQRILLIHPLGYDPQVAGRDISRLANLMPPLGLAQLAAYVEQEEHEADLIDCFAHPDSDDLIDSLVRTRKPQFIGADVHDVGFPGCGAYFSASKTHSSRDHHPWWVGPMFRPYASA